MHTVEVATIYHTRVGAERPYPYRRYGPKAHTFGSGIPLPLGNTIPHTSTNKNPPTTYQVGLCFGVPLPPSQQGSTNQCWPFTGNRMISFRKAKIPQKFAPAAQPPPKLATLSVCVSMQLNKERTRIGHPTP